MTRPMRPLAALLAVAMLVACGGNGSSPSPTPDPTDMPTASPATDGPTASPASPSPPSNEPSASPTDGGSGDFTCDLPVVDAGTAPIANITDVRVGTHDGYDRFVIEFEQGTPEFTLDRAEPPFTQDGSGAPVEVDGDSFLALVMRGGTKQTDAGTSSYEGSTDFEAGFPTLVQAVETGDFERQSTWILGLTDDACVRVLLLDEPPRLVIDVEH